MNQNFCIRCLKSRKLTYLIKTLKRSCANTPYVQNNSETVRINKANIQMLSPELHTQIFDGRENIFDEDVLLKVEKHLKSQNLYDKKSAISKNINFELPQLKGENLAEHFEEIGKEQTQRYIELAEILANSLLSVPPRPLKWLFKPGWTKYNKNGTFLSVDQPDDHVLVYDVEVCVNAGNVPIIAVAVSTSSWYCWISEYLVDLTKKIPKDIKPKDLIPYESKDTKRLLIGHNVAFDRTYLSGQYELKCDETRFIDTLSLHMCISGVTNEQRNYLNSKNHIFLYDWMEVGTTNSLAKVYEFYCGKKLDKSIRDLFVEGTLEDIQENFQNCVNYCASDVQSTHEVFQALWPMFREHLPHPVSLAGMLEMGTSYLPIDSNWKTYIERSESMFQNVTSELKKNLMTVAEDTLSLTPHQRFKDDPWLWNLDWSIHKTVLKGIDESMNDDSCGNFDKHVEKITSHLSDKRKNQLHLPGYPKWYRDLCIRDTDPNYKPGPCHISSQTKVTPSLLRMTWDGYPLHHEQKHGWGYLKPHEELNIESGTQPMSSERSFPYKNFLKEITSNKDEKKVENDEPLAKLMTSMYASSDHKNQGIDIGILGVRFHKLPHKNGEAFNVGNPLAKDFLNRIEDGTLSAKGGFNAKKIIELNKMLAFWRNGRKRITSQSTVWLDESKDGKVDRGVILPQVITAGTVTRRAVEPTWLTASNPRRDRIGSELKSLVRAPPSYFLIGADVDSQELWIASLLGDSNFAKIHGCTALSWMTLQGKKQDGTDLHSRTAATIGMDRDEAKVFNYGRIYGAGEKFAIRLLMQFNHKLTENEAEKIASKLYEQTKGVRSHELTEDGMLLADKHDINYSPDGVIDTSSLKRLLYALKLSWKNRSRVVKLNKEWRGGSESAMFNKLERIALSDEPRTPVLGCLITKALQPKYVHNYYKTSRVNWVVQSSAVDYLHLMLTSMKWLCDEYMIDARFAISIHDEVRYIVHEDDKYRAALALQISNLLTRSIFAYQLEMYDLPQCVAFFSSVDIDSVLRKETDMDCITPSNPYGLFKEYGIPEGESLDISDILERTGGNLSRN